MPRKLLRVIDTRKKIKGKDGKEKKTAIIDLKNVEILSSLGLTQKDIALLNGIAPETLSRTKLKKPEIDQAIQQGKKKDLTGLLTDLAELIKRAKKLDDKLLLKAIKYKLSAFHGISEKFEVGGAVKVEFDKVEVEIVKGRRKRRPGNGKDKPGNGSG